MNSTQQKILDAAIEVFSRYGVRRATMGDVAEQAEVSRQTLYAAFKNKDEILATATEALGVQIMQRINAACAHSNSIADTLDAYILHAVLEPYDLMHKMPDARDLMSGVGKATDEVIRKMEADKAQLLQEQFRQYEDALTAAGTDAKTIADFFERASIGFKYSATDRTQLESLLATLKASVLAMLKLPQ